MDLDTTDHAILRWLQEDGRITNAELSDRVNLSASACLRRVRGLEEAGVIDRYVALLDPATIGRPTTVFVEITLESQEEHHLDEFEAAVVQHPAVRSAHLMAGNADYLVKVVCEDVAHYEQLHRTHLAVLPHVARIRSSFALRTICDRTAYELRAAIERDRSVAR
ncbi:MAG: Lrp/AsnC family transcriptional regulator [Acidimicrobiia bacterium]|nr:Lrp/AsnC family transcriptional regulator [Acidimicrobiia bacterium]